MGKGGSLAAVTPERNTIDFFARALPGPHGLGSTRSRTQVFMVFILNDAQNRDTLAINSKLDALVLAIEMADNRLIGLERLPATEAQAIQQEVHALRDLADEAAAELTDRGGTG